MERTLARIDKVLAIAGRDRAGDVIIKVVNSAPEPATMRININGITGVQRGTVTVLTGDDPLGENSFEEAKKIAPTVAAMEVSGSAFEYTFQRYSVTVLRLGGNR